MTILQSFLFFLVSFGASIVGAAAQPARLAAAHSAAASRMIFFIHSILLYRRITRSPSLRPLKISV